MYYCGLPRNFESCVWRAVLYHSSHYPQEVLLAQFSLYVHIGDLKPHSFFFRLYVKVFQCFKGYRPEFTIAIFILQAASSRLVVWRWLKVGWKWKTIFLLLKQSHEYVHSKTLSFKGIKSVYRDAKWCFDASWLLNPLTAKLFNMNFHPLEVVYRWRDPQLQVSENYFDLTKWRSTLFKIMLVDVTFYL